ncbi:MAG: tyrosine-type recombinase/integrase [Lachnospiraceae bacterium]|nr:tyrosine-type recombinase/integrase [Lachnospiraceae bacterium]
MAKTQPMKETNQISALKQYFYEREEIRNYALVVIGLNTSLRISDVLQLRWQDVFNYQKKTYRHHIIVIEKKTQKENIVAINTAIIDALKALKKIEKNPKPEHYLFTSRKGDNQPITRQHAHAIIKKASEILGFEDNISCHSLRKTFGYQAWKQGVQPALLMSIYNHSSYEITKRYLGISQDERDQVFLNIML